jgi:hypothetical protein
MELYQVRVNIEIWDSHFKTKLSIENMEKRELTKEQISELAPELIEKALANFQFRLKQISI